MMLMGSAFATWCAAAHGNAARHDASQCNGPFGDFATRHVATPLCATLRTTPRHTASPCMVAHRSALLRSASRVIASLHNATQRFIWGFCHAMQQHHAAYRFAALRNASRHGAMRRNILLRSASLRPAPRRMASLGIAALRLTTPRNVLKG